MPVSHYFNNYSGTVNNEQRLLEDVVTESIKIMGHDVRYLPRESWDGDDSIFGEQRNAKFGRAYTIEMYLINVEGFGGDGDFFSKFGLEIRDTSNFVVSRRSFERYVPANFATRPREGDLIFVPVMNKIFEIKFVEEDYMFFPVGKKIPAAYELRCEVFRYNNESIDTGIEALDRIETRNSYAVELIFTSGTGNYQRGELVYQGSSYATANASAEVANWDGANTTLKIINIKGEFNEIENVVGVTTNSNYVIANTDVLIDVSDYDMYDNRDLQTEADIIIDDTEINPFGAP